MDNALKRQQAFQEYEELGKIISPNITFTNSRGRFGECYLECNTVFKNVYIKYEGDIRVLNSDEFKVYNNPSQGKITVTNSGKKRLNENVLFRYNGHIDTIINAVISGFGQKISIGVEVIKGIDEPIPISENENLWNTSSEILKTSELIPQRGFKLNNVNKGNLFTEPISSKLPSSYRVADDTQIIESKIKVMGEKCGNCKHIKYPMSSNQTGICHLWKAKVNLPFLCDRWEKRKGE